MYKTPLSKEDFQEILTISGYPEAYDLYMENLKANGIKWEDLSEEKRFFHGAKFYPVSIPTYISGVFEWVKAPQKGDYWMNVSRNVSLFINSIKKH